MLTNQRLDLKNKINMDSRQTPDQQTDGNDSVNYKLKPKNNQITYEQQQPNAINEDQENPRHATVRRSLDDTSRQFADQSATRDIQGQPWGILPPIEDEKDKGIGRLET